MRKLLDCGGVCRKWRFCRWENLVSDGIGGEKGKSCRVCGAGFICRFGWWVYYGGWTRISLKAILIEISGT